MTFLCLCSKISTGVTSSSARCLKAYIRSGASCWERRLWIAYTISGATFQIQYNIGPTGIHSSTARLHTSCDLPHWGLEQLGPSGLFELVIHCLHLVCHSRTHHSKLSNYLQFPKQQLRNHNVVYSFQFRTIPSSDLTWCHCITRENDNNYSNKWIITNKWVRDLIIIYC